MNIASSAILAIHNRHVKECCLFKNSKQVPQTYAVPKGQ